MAKAATTTTPPAFKMEFRTAEGWQTLYGHGCETVEEANAYAAHFNDPDAPTFRVVTEA